MAKAVAVRRIAAATAFGGGGLGLLGGSVYGLLKTEAVVARRRIGDTLGMPLDADGLYGAGLRGTPIRLAVLGDSAAAGYGATVPQDTFGAFLATGLSTLSGRPVVLRCVAAVGAKSSDLAGQVGPALQINPDVCIVIVGANDVTHAVWPPRAVRALRDTLEGLRRPVPGLLRATAPEVVVGTVPDLGTVLPIPTPLRQVARRWSRRLAAAQTVVAVESGAHSVSLGTILGPEFAARPADMFGPDRYHPSPRGYRDCATVMLPTVAAALGVLPDDTAEHEGYRGEGVFTLPRAASAAAESTGTEVTGADVRGSDRGPLGRWASLRHRRRHPIPPPDAGQVRPGAGPEPQPVELP
ncbi:MAG TPA: SGNH/GDSL hydrolase family protein [Nocardioidaceae bacterium]|nr:SGNH/GDSL hydrolase family protein [Nocardioidaceae bacterium]